MSKKKQENESLRTKFKFASINKSYRMIYGHQAAAVLEAVLAQMEYWESKGKLKTKGKLPNYTTTYADVSYHSGVPIKTLQKLNRDTNPLVMLEAQGLITWINTGVGTPHILKVDITKIEALFSKFEKVDDKIREIFTFIVDYKGKKEAFMNDLSKADGKSIIATINKWISIVRDELEEETLDFDFQLEIPTDQLEIAGGQLEIASGHRKPTKNNNNNNNKNKKNSLKTPSPAAGQESPSSTSPASHKELVQAKRLPNKVGSYGGSGKPQGKTKEEKMLNDFYFTSMSHTTDGGNRDTYMYKFLKYDYNIQKLIVEEMKLSNTTWASKAFRFADVLRDNKDWAEYYIAKATKMASLGAKTTTLAGISADITKSLAQGQTVPKKRVPVTIEQEVGEMDFTNDI